MISVTDKQGVTWIEFPEDMDGIDQTTSWGRPCLCGKVNCLFHQDADA